jgi:hypothetical protein
MIHELTLLRHEYGAAVLLQSAGMMDDGRRKRTIVIESRTAGLAMPRGPLSGESARRLTARA